MALFSRKEKSVIEDVKTHRLSGTAMLSYEVSNLQMTGARERQEDSFAFVNALDVTEILKNGLLAIVADGMGGLNDGKRVSETAIAGFISAFHALDRGGNIPEQLFKSVKDVNRAIVDEFHGDGGTTVVLVMIYQSSAYWISVGDSAIYLKRGGGLFKLNRDHTYENELYAKEFSSETIDKRRVENDPDKARLSEFLGNSTVDDVDYNIKPLLLQKNDTLLLCSDGISSFIDEASISAALAFPPAKACEHLKNLVSQRQHPRQDNFTGLVIRCDD